MFEFRVWSLELLHQKMYCIPICIARLPTFCTMKPKSPDVGLVTALPRRARFRTLNTSRRKSKRCEVLATLNPLRSNMFTSQKPGWRIEFFSCVVANVPVAGALYAVRSNQIAPRPDVGSGPHSVFRPASGSPVTSYSWLPLPGPTPAMSIPGDRTSNGAPDCAFRTPERFQSPNTHRSGAAEDSSVGNAYRADATSTCGRSRSEM